MARKVKVEEVISTIEEVQREVDRIAGLMLAKGLIKPFCGFDLRSNATPNMFARWDVIGKSTYDVSTYEWFRGKTVAEMIAAADVWVDALPTPQERAHSDFTKLVATALEFGKANGFDDVLVNPLAEAMKRLSENALEFHGAGVGTR